MENSRADKRTKMIAKFKLFARKECDSAEVSFSKLLILLIALTCCVCGLFWSALYLFVFGWGIVTFLPLLFVLIVGSAIPVSHYLRNHKILVYAQILCIMWVTALIQWSIGSLDQSGFVTAWSFVGPLVALIFLSFRASIAWMVMFILIIFISAVFEPNLFDNRPSVSQQTKGLFYLMNIGMASSVVFAASAWFALTIKKEKSISDNLLLNILPAEVAEELKVNGKVEPKFLENATVLFTDFKEFTKIAASLSAKEMVTEINYCFSAFDEIISRYGIEKIKTIGDAYMAAGGINDQECPPCNVVKAGLEMQQFMSTRRSALEKAGADGFEMRLGIHTGHVVAGVVGIKKFQYDIWGDTVNIASRMEHHGDVGRVNVSNATYEQVKDKFTCEYRGEIEVKGKGYMEMYFVC